MSAGCTCTPRRRMPAETEEGAPYCSRCGGWLFLGSNPLIDPSKPDEDDRETLAKIALAMNGHI